MTNQQAKTRKRILKIYLFFLAGCIFITTCGKESSELWYCPMHPNYTAPRKGTCPICGMDLVKKETGKKETGNENGGKSAIKDGTIDHAEHSFHLSPEKAALIGIKVFRVELRNMEKKIQSPGRIAYDPELYQALIEYKQALNLSYSLKGLTADDQSMRSGEISQPAKTRLKMMGLSDHEIYNLSRSNLNELILGGTGGTTHVFSQIFESDIADIKNGQKIEVSVVAYPGQIFYGKIMGIGTVLNAKNRSLRIHAEILDRKNLLKPQMFATVEIIVKIGRVLVIPKSSVIDTGLKKIVYKRIESGRYMPVEVKTGRENEDFYEVLGGVKKDEEVAFGGTFMLDSEAKLILHEPQSEHSH